MAKKLTLEKLRSKLNEMHVSDLREALVDIALRVSFDEDGKYNPEESVAAGSAADFVESVKHTFRHSLDITL